MEMWSKSAIEEYPLFPPMHGRQTERNGSIYLIKIQFKLFVIFLEISKLEFFKIVEFDERRKFHKEWKYGVTEKCIIAKNEPYLKANLLNQSVCMVV